MFVLLSADVAGGVGTDNEGLRGGEMRLQRATLGAEGLLCLQLPWLQVGMGKALGQPHSSTIPTAAHGPLQG